MTQTRMARTTNAPPLISSTTDELARQRIIAEDDEKEDEAPRGGGLGIEGWSFAHNADREAGTRVAHVLSPSNHALLTFATCAAPPHSGQDDCCVDELSARPPSVARPGQRVARGLRATSLELPVRWPSGRLGRCGVLWMVLARIRRGALQLPAGQWRAKQRPPMRSLPKRPYHHASSPLSSHGPTLSKPQSLAHVRASHANDSQTAEM